MEQLYAFLIGGGVGCIFIFIFRKNLKARRNAMIKSIKSFFTKGSE